MKRSLIMLSAACMLVLATAAQGAVKKGDVELEIQGGWLMEKAEQGTIDQVDQVTAGATGTDLNSWGAMVGLSVFTSKNFQVGLTGFYTQLDGDPQTMAVEGFPEINASFDLSMTMYGVGGRARWHFTPTKKWVPYVGVQGFWASANVDVTVTSETLASGTVSSSPSGILWGPIVGVRCQLGSNDALTLEYQYHLWSGDLDNIMQEGHGVFVGLAHRLK